MDRSVPQTEALATAAEHLPLPMMQLSEFEIVPVRGRLPAASVTTRPRGHGRLISVFSKIKLLTVVAVGGHMMPKNSQVLLRGRNAQK